MTSKKLEGFLIKTELFSPIFSQKSDLNFPWPKRFLKKHLLMKILRNFKLQISNFKFRSRRSKTGIALEAILNAFKYLKETLVPLKFLLCQ